MCNQRTYLSNIVGQRADIILLSRVSLPNNVDVTALSVVRSQMSRARPRSRCPALFFFNTDINHKSIK